MGASQDTLIDITPNDAQNKKAILYLSFTRPEILSELTGPGGSDAVTGGVRKLNFLEWAEARNNQKRYIDLELPRLYERRDSALDTLKRILLSGKVPTRTRAIKGGKFIEHSADFWNESNFDEALHLCRIREDWIFVDRSTFDREIHKLGETVRRPLSTAEARMLLTREWEEKGSLSQRRAEQLVLPGGGWKRAAVRHLHREVTGDVKPGPKRPRRTP
jgi:hypothetical protein